VNPDSPPPIPDLLRRSGLPGEFLERPWPRAGTQPYTDEFPQVDDPPPESGPQVSGPDRYMPEPPLPPGFAGPPPGVPPTGMPAPPVDDVPGQAPGPDWDSRVADARRAAQSALDDLFSPPQGRAPAPGPHPHAAPHASPGTGPHAGPHARPGTGPHADYTDPLAGTSVLDPPGLPEPPGPPGAARKTNLVLTVSVAMAVLAGVILVVGIVQSRYSAAADSSRDARPPAARPPAGPPAAQDGVPKGFRTYQDRDGFSLAVPEKWGKPQRKRTGLFFYSPDDNRRYIQIAHSGKPAADAYTAWKKLEKAKKPTLPNYRRIRLEKINYPGATTAADWEFSWSGETAKMHILDRTFVVNGRGYAILISAPDKKWKKTYKQLQPVFNSFKPA
jgi:hypothetical protein